MKLTVSVLLALLNVSAWAVEPRVFGYQAPLTGDAVGEHSLARVPLSVGVMRHTRQENFSDLRLYDNKGREVPYALYPDIKFSDGRHVSAMELVKHEDLPGRAIRVTLKCKKPDWRYEGVVIETDNRDYEKNVKVETSADGQRWQPRGEGAIFDFYDFSPGMTVCCDEVEFPETDARYLRLTISDAKPAGEPQCKGLAFYGGARSTAPFRVGEVRAWLGQLEVERLGLVPVPLTVSDIGVGAEGETWFLFKTDRLPLAKIELDIRTKYFYRYVEYQYQGGDPLIYNLEKLYRLPNHAKPRLQLGLNGGRHDELKLVVKDNGSEPLNLNGATGYCIPMNLYFTPEPGKTYRLCFGADNIGAPRYNFPEFLPADSEQLAGAAAWQLGEVIANPQLGRGRR